MADEATDEHFEMTKSPMFEWRCGLVRCHGGAANGEDDRLDVTHNMPERLWAGILQCTTVL